MSLKCPYVKNIRLPKPVRGNGKVITHIKTGCGKCTYCQSSIKLDWIFRMEQEDHDTPPGLSQFFTLTYEDHYIKPTKLFYPHIQSWAKRCRKAGANFKYFAVGEYGTKTWRPHWHVITFGLDPELGEEIWRTGYKCKADSYAGQYGGITQVDPVNSNRMQYVVNYLDKPMWHEIIERDPKFTGIQEMRKMSKGIGEGFIHRMDQQHINRYLETGEYPVKTSFKASLQLPRYYLVHRYGLHKNIDENGLECLTAKKVLKMDRETSKFMQQLERKGITPFQHKLNALAWEEQARKRAQNRKRE